MNYQAFIIGAVTTADSYPYLTREMDKPLHPVMVALLDADAIGESDAGELTREWPHVSKDGKRVAYTASADKGEEDRQAVTSVTAYVNRFLGI